METTVTRLSAGTPVRHRDGTIGMVTFDKMTDLYRNDTTHVVWSTGVEGWHDNATLTGLTVEGPDRTFAFRGVEADNEGNVRIFGTTVDFPAGQRTERKATIIVTPDDVDDFAQAVLDVCEEARQNRTVEVLLTLRVELRVPYKMYEEGDLDGEEPDLSFCSGDIDVVGIATCEYRLNE